MLQSVLAHRPQAVKVAAAPLAKHPLALLRNTAEVLCPEHARAAEVNRWPTLSALRIGPTYMGLQLTHVCPERLEVLLQIVTAQLQELRVPLASRHSGQWCVFRPFVPTRDTNNFWLPAFPVMLLRDFLAASHRVLTSHRRGIPFAAPGGPSRVSLGAFGGPRGSLLGASGGPLGGVLGASWGPLGGLLGASWGPPGGLLGASWGPPGGLLGASWGPLGASWRPLGDLLGASCSLAPMIPAASRCKDQLRPSATCCGSRNLWSGAF